MAVVVTMPRKNRRDCRTEEKKKAGASAPREAQIRAIQKQRKSGAAAGEADDAPALTGAAASFLADLRAEAAAAAPATAAPAAAAPATIGPAALPRTPPTKLNGVIYASPPPPPPTSLVDAALRWAGFRRDW